MTTKTITFVKKNALFDFRNNDSMVMQSRNDCKKHLSFFPKDANGLIRRINFKLGKMANFLFFF